MKDRLEERLRRLNIGPPDPALRGRVFRAAGAALPGSAELSTGQGWLAGWRVEALLTAGVAMAAIFFLCLEPIPLRGTEPLPRFGRVPVVSLIEGPHPDQDLEAHYRARHRWAARNSAAKRRVGNDHQTDVLEEYRH